MSTAMPAETLLGRAPAPLGLRIRGTERDGHVVWLNSPKVTIGSARGSTLRLCAPGIAPIHCLIVRGSHHTLARRWSPNTRYNDSGFDEAALSAGDRLAIGPLEFEVVERKAEGRRRKAEGEDSLSLESPAQIVETVTGATVADTVGRVVEDVKSLRTVRRLAARLKLAQRQARRRIRKLTAELRAARLRTAELERQLTEYGDEAARGDRRQAEWDQQRRILDDERQQWRQSQAHIEQLLVELDRRREAESIQTPPPPSGDPAVAESEIARLQAKFDADRRNWESQRAAWDTELAERQAALQHVANQRERLQANLDRQQSVFEQQLESLEQRQQQLESQTVALAEQQQATDDQRRVCLADLDKLREERMQISTERELIERERATLNQQQTEIAKSSAQLHADRQELDAQREELIEVANDGADEDAGQSDDVFARLRALDILKDDGAEPVVDETPASAVPEPPVADERPSPNSTIQGAAEQTAGEPRFDDEESINEYMARLLQRVRGGNESAATAQNDIAARVPGEPAPRVALKTSSAIAESNRPSAANEPSVTSLSEFEPRTVAPEKTRDLAAMREIANFTARTAIAKHQWRRRIVFLLKRFLLGVVAMVCGIALVVIAPSPQSREFYFGLAAIAASLVWFLPALYRAKRCKRQAEKSQQRATADYERTPNNDNNKRAATKPTAE